MISLAP